MAEEAEGMVGVVPFEHGEEAGGEGGHEEDGAEVAGEGVAFAGVAAEIDGVVPDEKEGGADGDAAGGDGEQGEAGVGAQPFEGEEDEEVVQDGAADEPRESGARLLAAFGRREVGEVFHRAWCKGWGGRATNRKATAQSGRRCILKRKDAEAQRSQSLVARSP